MLVGVAGWVEVSKPFVGVVLFAVDVVEMSEEAIDESSSSANRALSTSLSESIDLTFSICSGCFGSSTVFLVVFVAGISVAVFTGSIFEAEDAVGSMVVEALEV